ncbi:hypothetical protein [Actinomyces ruminicola]|uniref:Helix-turn-helix of DDE superfamily endonuclease n=1 Tax=Actinomyces ruminicola TaxID=332524 RepID=A0A1G9YWQ5_9ACTO|nr:hypothetical protein [Actinomyces ruminicola]SDN12971.1 hypothetical protein SAMN04487766_11454 [Actinomyces ruminicola]
MESFDVSQPTVSGIIRAYTTLIADALAEAVPTVEDLDSTTTR